MKKAYRIAIKNAVWFIRAGVTFGAFCGLLGFLMAVGGHMDSLGSFTKCVIAAFLVGTCFTIVLAVTLGSLSFITSFLANLHRKGGISHE